MKNVYGAKIRWSNYIGNMIFFICICVIVITAIFSNNNASYQWWWSLIVIMPFATLQLLSLVFIFGYKIKIDNVTVEVTENLFKLVQTSIKINEIKKIYYEILEPYGLGGFLPGIQDTIIVEFTVGDKFIKRKWLVGESDFLKIMKNLKVINNNIIILTEYPSSDTEGVEHGKSFDKRFMYKWRDSKYFLPLIICGLIFIFLTFMVIGNIK